MIKRFGKLTMALFLFSQILFAADMENNASDIDYDRLEKGELLTFTEVYDAPEGLRKKRIVGIYLIDSPPEAVWEILKNWDAMGDYVPGLRYYKTIHKTAPENGDGFFQSIIEGRLDIPVVSVHYTVRVLFSPYENYRISWSLLKDDALLELKNRSIPVRLNTKGLEDISGYGFLEPFDGGQKTIYYYAPVVELSVPLPSFVERFIIKNTLIGYLKAVKKRAEENN